MQRFREKYQLTDEYLFAPYGLALVVKEAVAPPVRKGISPLLVAAARKKKTYPAS